MSSVRLALVASVTCTPARCQASQLSIVPGGQLAGLGPGARARQRIEQPRELGAREVGRERQPGLLAEAIDVAEPRPRARRCACPARRSRWRAGARSRAPTARPSRAGWRCRSRRRRPGRAPAAASASSMHARAALQDLVGVVLDPPRARRDLAVLLLGDRDDAPGPVEQQAAAARRALVERGDVARSSSQQLLHAGAGVLGAPERGERRAAREHVVGRERPLALARPAHLRRDLGRAGRQ